MKTFVVFADAEERGRIFGKLTLSKMLFGAVVADLVTGPRHTKYNDT